MTSIANFTQLVRICIEAAEEKYGLLGPVDIRFDLKGMAAGQAQLRRGKLIVRFNREALAKDWDHMVRETIPHEIAHLVAYARPNLGAKGHNAMWKRIAQSLGCKGDRCHTIQLTPTRKRVRYFYKLPSGTELLVGPQQHKNIQKLGLAAGYKLKTTGERIDRCHYKPEGHKIAA